MEARWHCAHHGAEWPEEGHVFPRRRARVARSIPQARGQQWSLPQPLVPEMVEQLVEVPKERYQDGIQQRTAEQIVALPAPVLLCSQSGFSRESLNRARLSKLPRPQAKTGSCSVQWSRTLSRYTKLPITNGFLNAAGYRSAQDLVQGKCGGCQNDPSEADF